MPCLEIKKRTLDLFAQLTITMHGSPCGHFGSEAYHIRIYDRLQTSYDIRHPVSVALLEAIQLPWAIQ